MNKSLKNILDTKPKFYLFIAIVAIIVIFGILKPFFSVSSTSYLFGMVEKKPDAKGLLKDFLKSKLAEYNDPKLAEVFDTKLNELEFLGCGDKTTVNDVIGYRCNFTLNNGNEKFRFKIQKIDNKYYPFSFDKVNSFN